MTAVVIATALTAMALAGCTAAEPRAAASSALPSATQPAASPSPTAPEASPTPVADADECRDSAWIEFGHMSASLRGDLVDRGPREFAAGTAILDANGAVTSYRVASGDAISAIGKRFCIANPLAVEDLNHTRMIAPDQVLLLRHDSDVPWVPFLNPDGDLPEGYQQIPYQQAVVEMGFALDKGDVAAMRRIFDTKLSPLFPNPDDAAVIADALKAGDTHALRQMFP